ncbi:hypothetical protein SAMN05444000_109145 [Shimia gijangensis]|uniref:Transposase n=1 Tax=Shimia gijangensis TaxID=1470563 RepID=A0A1M6JX13_9RHOB|nr:hypothetical protein SAMN05444000_109145 [Shimia gijangensis]
MQVTTVGVDLAKNVFQVHGIRQITIDGVGMTGVNPRVLGKPAVTLGAEIPRWCLHDAIREANARFNQNTFTDAACSNIRPDCYDFAADIRPLDTGKFQRFA